MSTGCGLGLGGGISCGGKTSAPEASCSTRTFGGSDVHVSSISSMPANAGTTSVLFSLRASARRGRYSRGQERRREQDS